MRVREPTPLRGLGGSAGSGSGGSDGSVAATTTGACFTASM